MTGKNEKETRETENGKKHAHNLFDFGLHVVVENRFFGSPQGRGTATRAKNKIKKEEQGGREMKTGKEKKNTLEKHEIMKKTTKRVENMKKKKKKQQNTNKRNSTLQTCLIFGF